jgi:large subunit ribosomal protein L15
MKLHDLSQAEGAKKTRKRRGRGIAAGQGKTAGFGTKGQGSRAGRGGKLYFEGGQLPLVRRLPHKRGFRNVNRVEYAVVNVAALNRFVAGSVVDIATLIGAGVLKNDNLSLKILGEGQLDRALTVVAHRFSESARAKIEGAGGAVELIKPA